MNDKFIMALDEGTTSARTLIIDSKGDIVASSQEEIAMSYPAAGWVEQDALEIWNTQRTTIQNVMNYGGFKGEQIAGIGITNQRETVVVWDKESGQPIYNAIVWQDRRTENDIKKIPAAMKKQIIEKTGLIPDAYFSATKLKWILDNIPGAKEKAKAGKLAFGTINTWLIWRLTKGQAFVTDPTNASRTMLYNLQTKTWDKDLLKYFDIPEQMLPEIKSNSEVYGKTFEGLISHADKTSIPIASSIGDQQAALVGQLGLKKGDTKITYGTGCFILMNIGEQPLISKNGLLTTVGYQINNKTTYALEGSVMIAGAAIQWLRDNLRIVYSSAETEWYVEQARKNPNAPQVYFVPSFSGLGSPYWDPSSRGAIFGLDRSVRREDIVKATVESLAFQANDVLNAMKEDSGIIKKIKVDGGAAKNDYLMQFQADISQSMLERPKNVETTGLGAAYLAGIATGVWKDFDDIRTKRKIDKIFNFTRTEDDVKPLLHGWDMAVGRTRNWLTDLEKD
ncbi:glycerol kinase GlpK [Mesoplasma lactucae]|uniref:glycerol kinase n=1 Tax=Mesoplasma lactucae ATCC 49193 TaxID=81460 RepID=A0A291ISY1_9MOLU|nr:glycerol kinase GlpK [Mesoplasma lactucae]ATG97797.1 glycerol kinase [Mesoplasma lactucae ATCC 49193]ATZ20425.1 glycerol kinase [Mesoplasma lactucae ATCC 49193]MCL8216597.1 Glycerol kinase [Mesoplasma lactucae ATCC 49193]